MCYRKIVSKAMSHEPIIAVKYMRAMTRFDVVRGELGFVTLKIREMIKITETD